MSPASICETRISSSYTVKAVDLNGYKLLHGGRLLTLADEAGFHAAYGFCGKDCLTVAVHRARFYQPCHEGDVLQLQAEVALTGTSSLWVPVNVLNATGDCIMDAVIIYAAVDKQQRPIRIDQVQAQSQQEKDLQDRMRLLRTDIRKGQHVP